MAASISSAHQSWPCPPDATRDRRGCGGWGARSRSRLPRSLRSTSPSRRGAVAAAVATVTDHDAPRRSPTIVWSSARRRRRRLVDGPVTKRWARDRRISRRRRPASPTRPARWCRRRPLPKVSATIRPAILGQPTPTSDRPRARRPLAPRAGVTVTFPSRGAPQLADGQRVHRSDGMLRPPFTPLRAGAIRSGRGPGTASPSALHRERRSPSLDLRSSRPTPRRRGPSKTPPALADLDRRRPARLDAHAAAGSADGLTNRAGTTSSSCVDPADRRTGTSSEVRPLPDPSVGNSRAGPMRFDSETSRRSNGPAPVAVINHRWGTCSFVTLWPPRPPGRHRGQHHERSPLSSGSQAVADFDDRGMAYLGVSRTVENSGGRDCEFALAGVVLVGADAGLSIPASTRSAGYVASLQTRIPRDQQVPRL